MKHVFIINSHTTFLTVCGVINYLHLNSSDVLFLKIRNYAEPKINIGASIIDMSTIDSEFVSVNHVSYRKRQALIKQLDSYLADVINDSFVFYAPHYASAFFQTIYTNNRCLEGAYIQEGAVPQTKAFLTESVLKLKLWHIMYDRLYLRTNRLWTSHYWYIKSFFKKQRKIESYSINNSFFRYLPSHNNIVTWPSIDLDVDIKKDSNIFIFDGFVSNGMVERDYYMNACNNLIKEYAGPINYIKFHPAQDLGEREHILSFFKENNYTCNILEDSIPVEIIISSFHDLSFVGFSSSLLYFAYSYNHKVTSGNKLLLGSDLYKSYLKRYGVCIFEENLKLLQ